MAARTRSADLSNQSARDQAGGGQGVGRLASPAVVALMRQRTARLGGLALGLLGLTLLVALLSYDPRDPSFDTATARHASNLAGPVGSVVADLLLQGFGLAAALPGLAMLAWAWRIASYRGIRSLTLRLAATLAALPTLAAALAAIPLPQGLAWPSVAGLGGAIGARLGHLAVAAGRHGLGPLGAALVWALGLTLAVTLTLLALGLTAGEWRVAGRTAVGAARLSIAGGRAGLGGLAWLLRHLGALGWPFRRRARHGATHGFHHGALGDTEPLDHRIDHRVGPWGRLRLLFRRRFAGHAAPHSQWHGHDLEPHLAMVEHDPRAAPFVDPRDHAAPPAPRPASARPAVPRGARPSRGVQEVLPLDEPRWRFPPLSLLKPAPPRAATGPQRRGAAGQCAAAGRRCCPTTACRARSSRSAPGRW